MYEAAVMVKNKTGLHARPATQLTQLVKKFASEIVIVVGEKSANAKSILNILMLNVNPGTEIIVRAEGDDERLAVDSIIEFINGLEE